MRCPLAKSLKATVGVSADGFASTGIGSGRAASLAGLGSFVGASPAQAGFYDTPGNGDGGAAGDPKSSGDPDVPTGVGRGVNSDGAITTMTTTEDGAAVVTDPHRVWTLRLMVVLLSLRGTLLRF